MLGGEVGPERVFVDTNVWLYGLVASQDEAKREIAKRIVTSDGIVISTQVINETCVNLLRKAKMAEATVRHLIIAFYDKYQVVDASQATLLVASSLREAYSLSYWDSLIVASALEAGCTTLYSEDMHHGLVIDDILRIVNPFVDATEV